MAVSVYYSCAAWRMSCKMGSVLCFGVTFVHANLCRHTFITFFVFVRHIELFKKVPFFCKNRACSPFKYGVKVSISTLVHCKDSELACEHA